MPTRRIVPRNDGEGSIGKPSKQWGDVQTKKINNLSIPLELEENSKNKFLIVNNDETGFEVGNISLTTIEELNNKIENIHLDYLEKAIHDIYYKLSLNDIYSDFDAFLIEDFKEPDQIDFMYVNITSINEDKNILSVTGLETIQIGNQYIIADGENYEYCFVKGVTFGNIVLKDPLTKDYNISNTYLLRSTILVDNGIAIVPSANKFYTWNVNEEWTGIDSGIPAIVNLAFTSNTLSQYNIEGDIVFSNGSITLN